MSIDLQGSDEVGKADAESAADNNLAEAAGSAAGGRGETDELGEAGLLIVQERKLSLDLTRDSSNSSIYGTLRYFISATSSIHCPNCEHEIMFN